MTTSFYTRNHALVNNSHISMSALDDVAHRIVPPCVPQLVSVVTRLFVQSSGTRTCMLNRIIVPDLVLLATRQRQCLRISASGSVFSRVLAQNGFDVGKKLLVSLNADVVNLFSQN